MKKFLLIVAGLAIALTLFLLYSKQPEPIPPHSQSAKLLLPGPHKVRVAKQRFTDSSRRIEANGDYPGAAERSLDVRIWAPSERPASPQPLLIYSHGFMSSGRGGSYLGKHLASHGYTVAAPTFPLSRFGAPGGPNPADVINQPADVSFVIDTLLAANVDPDGDYFQYIDPERIAAAGLSLGGMTTEMVAYHPILGDSRVAVAASIAGPAYMFNKRFFDHRSLPFMMIATPQDAMVSYQHNAANIPEKIPDSVLVTIDGASHAGFASTAKWLRWMDNPDSLGCEALMRNLGDADDESWTQQIGTLQMGVLPGEPPGFCTTSPLPKTMNPLRQHQLNTLAITSFLQCYLANDQRLAETQCHYLKKTMSAEIPEISVVH